jgi:hypothetical protein
MNMQLAEVAAKILMLIQCQVLVTKKDYPVFHQCVMDFLKCLITKRLREVNTTNFRSNDRAYGFNLYRYVRFQLTSPHSRSGGTDRKYLERLITRNRNPVAMPNLRKIIPNRAMLRRAVVPKCNRFLSPAEAAMKFWCSNVVTKHFQDRVALVLIQPFNPRRKVFIHEQCFLARDRMCTHNRVE